MGKTKNSKVNRFLSLALCVVMLFGLMTSVSCAFAVEYDPNVTFVPGALIIDYIDLNTGTAVAPSTTINYEDMDDYGDYRIVYLPQEVPDVPGMIPVGCQCAIAVGGGEGSSHTTGGEWYEGDYSGGDSEGSGVHFYYDDQAEHYRVLYDYESTKISSGSGLGGVVFLFLQYDEQNNEVVEVAPQERYFWADGDRSYSVTPPTIAGKAVSAFMLAEYAPGVVDNFYQATNGVKNDFAYNGNPLVNPYVSANYTALTATFPATGSVTEGSYQVYTVLYEDSETVDPNVASFDIVLLLDSDASVPGVTVTPTISAGTGIAAVPGTSLAVLSPSAATGVTGTPTISSAVFSPSDSTVTSVEGVTVAAGKKADVKSVTVDFSNMTFAQPGIFRYLITEPSSGSGLTYDTQLGDTTNGTRYQRVLDVYVIRDANDDYVIGGYVLHEVAGTVAEGATTAADKSTGFVNEYATTGLTLECLVEGNQASIDKYFKYDITMDNPYDTQFSVTADWSNATGALNPVENPATSYTNAVITAANTSSWTSNADGTLTKTVYLKNGQKIAIDGMPVGTVYSIEVTEEDYGPDWNIKIGGVAHDAPEGSDPVDATGNQTLGASVEDVQFILTREGVVPTGVALSILPGGIIMIGGLAAIVVMKNRKKEEGADA